MNNGELILVDRMRVCSSIHLFDRQLWNIDRVSDTVLGLGTGRILGRWELPF